jgi:hypothetical protein
MAVGLPAKTTYVDGDVFSASDINDTNGTINLTAAPFAAGKNRLINGNMAVAQRGTSFTASSNNDDAYTLDRWYILSDTNDVIDVTQATDVPTNGLYSIGLDVETVNKKFGIAQIIEQQNSIGLIGNTVTLSFKAKVSSTTKLDNVKAAIVAWSGTADTVTSDIISAWGVEGTNPTLIANATYENTPANLGVTTSWASYSITAAIDTASTKNILVFIWSDVTDTTLGDFLYVTDVQLEAGSTATGFQTATGTNQGELALCQRYLPAWTAPATGVTALGIGMNYSSTQSAIVLPTPVQARVRPTGITIIGGGTNQMYQSNANPVNCSSVIWNGATLNSLQIVGTTASTIVAGNATNFLLGLGNTLLATGCEL